MSMKVAKGYFSTFPHLMCKGLPAYEQITFIWLFHHANSEGICFPSISTLAEECGISRDSIKRSLKNLEDRGYIKKENRKKDDGSNTSNLYSVILIDQANSTEGGADSTIPPGANSTEGGADSTTNYNQLTKSNSELNKEKVRSKKNNSESSEKFETAWSLYPKRQGANSRVAACKCWNARIKEGVKEDDLILATKNYQILCTNSGNADTNFVMQGQRFYGANKEYEQFINLKPEELNNAKNQRLSFRDQKQADCDAVKKRIRDEYNEAWGTDT